MLFTDIKLKILVLIALFLTISIKSQASVPTKAVGKNLFSFRDMEGIDFDLSSKEKKATITLNKYRGANNFTFKIEGAFDNKEASYVNNDGLVADVIGTLGYIRIFDVNTSPAANSNALNIYAKKMADLDKQLSACEELYKSENATAAQIKELSARGKPCFWIANLIKDTEIKGAKEPFSYPYFSSSVSYAPGEFQYLDINNPSVKNKSKTEGYEGKFAYGYFQEYASLSEYIQQYKIEAGISYSKQDKPSGTNKMQNICIPVPETQNISRCQDVYLAPALNSKTTSFYVLYAANFSDKSNDIFNGIEAKLSRSMKTTVDIMGKEHDYNRWILDFPVTLFVSDDKKIKAGIAYKHTEKLQSDDSDFDRNTISFFVNAGFGVLNF